jgi:recombination protein RecA
MIKTGNDILDATLRSLTKSLGKPDAFTQGPGFTKADAIPTGSTALDMATGIGGVPVGRVIELYGPESSGKTSLALSICANWVKMRATLDQENRKALYIDLEHVTGADLVTGIGVPLEDIIWFRAETTQEALNTLETLVSTEQIGFVILDSVDALQSETELAKKIGEESIFVRCLKLLLKPILLWFT